MSARRDAPALRVADLESRATAADHADLRLWLRLMAVHKRIGNEIRHRLREGFGVTLARFDMMAQLARHPDGLRMGELSKRLMVTTGNITQLADEMEREGLVARAADPASRRATRIRLTPRGAEVFAAMAAAHETWIVELFAGLGRAEKAQLHAILGRHKAALMRVEAAAAPRPWPPRGAGT